MATNSRPSTSAEDPSLAYDYEQPLATSPQSLSQAVHTRRAEYTRPRTIRVKIGSWNVAACRDVERDIGGWFVDGKGIDMNLAGFNTKEGIIADGRQEDVEDVTAQEERRRRKQSTLPHGDSGTVAGGNDIGLYVLGLQEVVVLASAKEYIGRVYTDPGPLAKWKTALGKALPDGYELVSEQQLSGLLLLIYASSEVAPTISAVSSVNIGTGVLGYLGNKGAVSTRIVLGESTRLVFINSHLASGTDPANLDRRCRDVAQILARTKFDPINWAGVLDDFEEGIGDEDFAFWFGDLNFRLAGLPGEDIRRLLMLHTRGEYGVGGKTQRKMDAELGENDEPIIVHHVDSDDDGSSAASTPRTSSFHDDDASSTTLPDPDDFVQDPHTDPTSLQATLDSLLPHDQLRQVQKQKKAFHDGWREGPITFLPTYKYDVGSVGMFDSSEKKRAPSWCDRILFRSRRDKEEYEGKSQEEKLARIKDAEMKARGLEDAVADDEVLFDYDPESDGLDDAPLSDYDENDNDNDGNAQEVATKEGFLDEITLELYKSHQRVLSSDHKPLDAVFVLTYDAVVPELKSMIHQEVARELDRAENEGRPTITVLVDQSHAKKDHSLKSSQDVVEGADFGDVQYQERITRGLTIANTGQVPAKFSFISRPAGGDEPDRVAPRWLNVYLDQEEQSPSNLELQLTLEPGDTINASLHLCVDDIEDVRTLNERSTRLDDVLVLRVVDGRDHFIPIKGHWLQSCFGKSISELICVPEGGVRALVPARGSGGGGAPINRGQDVQWSAPRELLKLTEVIEKLTERTLAERDMIDGGHAPDSNGWPFESWTFTNVRNREELESAVTEALDADKSLADSFAPGTPAIERLEAISDILIKFVASLSDGIITAELWEALETEAFTRKEPLSAEDTRTWVLDVLSSAPHHNISFVFLLSTLGKMIAELTPVSRNGKPSSPLENGRRSLSFRGRSVPVADAATNKRLAVSHRFAEIFAPIIIRGTVGANREKERKAAEERKREIIENFLLSYAAEG